MDQKAQISAEFVLLIGVIFVVVLIIASYIGEQNESNMISVSAREGAMHAVSQITLVNRNLPPITINNITMTGEQNKTIQIDLSNSLSAHYTDIILNKTLESMASQGYRRENNSIVTSRHIYNVTIV